MHLKSIAECPKGAFCNTFELHKATFVFGAFVLSIFEWPHKTGLLYCILLKVTFKMLGSLIICILSDLKIKRF